MPEEEPLPQEPVTAQTAHVDITPSLLLRLRDHDPDAGVLLNDLYRDAIARFCWGYLGSIEDAEDAVQEIFCKVLKAGEPPERFRAWLYKVARNHCLNVLRSRARRQDKAPLNSEIQPDAALTGILTKLVKGEQRSRLVHLVAALPPSYREILRLRYAENLPRAEIAEILELTESVVKSRLYEGLKKLREHASLVEEP